MKENNYNLWYYEKKRKREKKTITLQGIVVCFLMGKQEYIQQLVYLLYTSGCPSFFFFYWLIYFLFTPKKKKIQQLD